MLKSNFLKSNRIKKAFLFFLLFPCLGSIVFIGEVKSSSEVEVSWDKTFGSEKYDNISSLVQTPNGNLLFGGYKEMGSSVNKWLLKTDIEGNVLFDQVFPNGEYSQINSILVTSNEQIFVLSYNPVLKEGIKVFKFENNNLVELGIGFQKAKSVKGVKIIESRDRNLLVVGNSTNAEGKTSIYFLKFDKNGKVISEKIIGDKDVDLVSDIVSTKDGNFLLCGSSISKNSFYSDIFLTKLSSKGEVVWRRTYGEKYSDKANSIIETSDGNFVVCGFLGSLNGNHTEAYIFKVHGKGGVLWEEKIESDRSDYFSNVVETKEKSLIVFGSSSSLTRNGDYDHWLVKMDLQNGEQIGNSQTFGGKKDESGISLEQLYNGDLILAGTTNSKGKGENDIELIRLNQPISLEQVREQIREYYEAGMTAFLMKKEFEPNEEYQKRMSQKNVKSNQLLREATKRNVDYSKVKLSVDKLYDTENQTFVINLIPFGEIILHVASEFAEKFKANIKSHKVTDLLLAFDADEELLVKKAVIYDETQEKSFPYKGKDDVAYIAQLPSNFTPQVEIDPDYDIEDNIPKADKKMKNSFAIVIGNKNYTNKNYPNVDFAIKDAETVGRYLVRAGGFEPTNVKVIKNATKGKFDSYFGTEENPNGQLSKIVKSEKIDRIFIFYSGHGAPGLKDKSGYLVPVDCSGDVSIGGYAAKTFFTNVSKLPVKSVFIALDACFSGLGFYKSASPVVPKIVNPLADFKKGVVITSSKNNEISSWYSAKKHGLFTYMFLKAIHNKNADKYDGNEKDGKLTFQEIFRYISDEANGIPGYATKIYERDQTPTLGGGAESNHQNEIFIEYD